MEENFPSLHVLFCKPQLSSPSGANLDCLGQMQIVTAFEPSREIAMRDRKEEDGKNPVCRAIMCDGMAAWRQKAAAGAPFFNVRFAAIRSAGTCMEAS